MRLSRLIVFGGLVMLVTTSHLLFAESEAAKQNKALFNSAVNKLYGNQAKQLESSVNKMHEKRDQAIERATEGSDLDADMKNLQQMGEQVMEAAGGTIDPKKLEMMKASLPPELQAQLGGSADANAVDLGMMQALEMFREMSQYQVENYLKLSLVPNPQDQENIFVQYPKFITYIATILRDKEALPSLLQISKQVTKLLIFFAFIVATFFLSKLLVKFYNRNVSALTAIGRFFVRVFTFYSLRLICFCYLFYDQLAPMGRLLKAFIIDHFTGTV